MQEINIYDLTEHEGAWAGLPHNQLLLDAFTAILQERLPARFGDRGSKVGSLAQPGFTWGDMVRQGIAALKRDPHFFVRWFKIVFVDLNDYRRWRDAAKQNSVAIAQQKLHRINRRDLRAAIRSYIESERSQGRQASQKRLWAWAKAVLPGTTYSRVMEEMSAVEGGKKTRGRPRKVEATR